jgi:hypothetical protein
VRGFRPSVSHARFLCQCFDEKGPRLFDFPRQAMATTIRRSLLHGPRVFAGGGPPVNCRSSFSNRGKRFWIDMFGNGFFRSPCRPVVWKGCWSFLGAGSLGKVISGSGREPCGGGPCKSAALFFRTGVRSPQLAPREHVAGCEGQQADLS